MRAKPHTEEFAPVSNTTRLALNKTEAAKALTDNPKLREKLRVECEKTARELGLRGPHRPPAPRRRSPFSPSTHDPSDPYAALT